MLFTHISREAITAAQTLAVDVERE